MAKPARSPVLGYNHNIRYHGRVFHVQTEDSGPGKPRLYTHLFYGGTILSSKKQEYDGEVAEDVVKVLMQQLHKAMIKELTHGGHDERIAAFFIARGEPPVLDERGAAAGPAITAAPVVPTQAAVEVVAAGNVADRPLAVSGSIEAGAPRPTPHDPSAPVVVAPVPTPVAPSPTRPHVSAAPAGTPRPVVVKPADVRRPPVVLASSADGVVVQRNVVINVGGGAPPVNGTPGRGARPRPAVPYVVREGTLGAPPPPARPAAPGAPPETQTQPLASGRDIRMPWDPPPARAIDAAVRTRAPGAPSERTPAERAFAPDLVTDKSLDEVILEYLSDDVDKDPAP
jgi:hypothetical protein